MSGPISLSLDLTTNTTQCNGYISQLQTNTHTQTLSHTHHCLKMSSTFLGWNCACSPISSHISASNLYRVQFHHSPHGTERRHRQWGGKQTPTPCSPWRPCVPGSGPLHCFSHSRNGCQHLSTDPPASLHIFCHMLFYQYLWHALHTGKQSKSFLSQDKLWWFQNVRNASHKKNGLWLGFFPRCPRKHASFLALAWSKKINTKNNNNNNNKTFWTHGHPYNQKLSLTKFKKICTKLT